MQEKVKDRWDKADIVLRAVAGLLTALVVAALGIIGSQYLKGKEAADTRERQQALEVETKVRLYSELMSKREEAESALRKDMFQSIIQSFLKPATSRLRPEEKVLNLELLTHNFHESLNLKPLFIDLKKEMNGSRIRKEGTERLDQVAREVTRKQMLVLEGRGESFDSEVDIVNRTFIATEESEGGHQEAGDVIEKELTVNRLTRRFRIRLQEIDAKRKEIHVSLAVTTPGSDGEATIEVADFWVGFFDFPMIDNTRLSNDQRCAVVLNEFGESTAQITLVYFPGCYAGLKDKPYYQDVVDRLLAKTSLHP